jgi:hypothetical protein
MMLQWVWAKLKKGFWFTMILLFFGLISRTVSWFSNAIWWTLIGVTEILCIFVINVRKWVLCVLLIGRERERERERESVLGRWRREWVLVGVEGGNVVSSRERERERGVVLICIKVYTTKPGSEPKPKSKPKTKPTDTCVMNPLLFIFFRCCRILSHWSYQF